MKVEQKSPLGQVLHACSHLRTSVCVYVCVCVRHSLVVPLIM